MITSTTKSASAQNKGPSAPEGTKLVRFTWIGYSGVRCCKMAPVASYEVPAEEIDLKLLTNGPFYPATTDTITGRLTYANGHQGLRIVPDPSSTR